MPDHTVRITQVTPSFIYAPPAPATGWDLTSGNSINLQLGSGVWGLISEVTICLVTKS